MKGFALIAALSLMGIARASFDLMLVGDNTTAGAQRVVRYDPVNRIVLGSFGGGFINDNIVDIAVDSVSSTAFVLQENGSLRQFNYNTGDFIKEFAVGSSSDSVEFLSDVGLLTFGGVVSSGTSPSRTYTVNGGIVGVYNGFASTPLYKSPLANWYANWGIDDGVTGINAKQYSLGQGTPLSTSATVSGWSPPGLRSPGAGFFLGDGNFYAVVSRNGVTEIWRQGANAFGFVGTTSTINNVGATVNSWVDAVRGHGNLSYILNGSTLTSYQGTTNTILGTQTLTFATAPNIRGMAIVLAPEPAPIFAIVLGLAAIASRRNRQRK